MLRKSRPQSRRGTKEMQKKYESPEMDVIELGDRDVIVASIVPGPGDTDVEQGGEGGW